MDFLRRHVFHNIGLKLVSLIAATLLWAAIAREPIAEVAVNVPVELDDKSPDLEISTETIPQAQIRVHGPADVVRQLNSSNVTAAVSLKDATPGSHTYDLGRFVHVPREVSVLQVIPSQLRISVDTRSSKTVEVHPRVIGMTAPGYRLQELTVNPSTATVTGPTKHVDAVEAVMTDPVDVSGVIGRATFSTHVYVADPLLRLATPSTVQVTVVTD